MGVALLCPQGNGGQHAAFGSAVEFGDDQAGEAQRFVKRFDLRQGVLPGVAVDHQKYFVGRRGIGFLNDTLDFFQLVHQMQLGG